MADVIGIGGPPFVAYKTLRNFLYAMKQGMPSRIDRSVVRSLSGSVQGQLLATLRFFGFVSGDGTPTHLLAKIVAVEGRERETVLREILRECYSFVFDVQFDLNRGTMRELEHLFAQQNLSGKQLQRAVLLFLELAEDAGFKLSRHISRASHKQRMSKRPTSVGHSSAVQRTDLAGDRLVLLLAKVPDWEAAWSDDIKIRWFDLVAGLAGLVEPTIRVTQ